MKQMMRTYKTEDGKSLQLIKQKFLLIEKLKKLMFGKLTLFVCGIQDLKRTIEIANNNDIKHIHLGTGTTFFLTVKRIGMNGIQYIKGLLENDFWVTLDFDLMTYGDSILECGWNEYRRFIHDEFKTWLLETVEYENVIMQLLNLMM